MLQLAKKIIPKQIADIFRPLYHFLWAFLSAIAFGFPSSNIKVLAITGTKGKSSTTEFVNAVLEAAGLKTAVLNTIRFKIGSESRPNLFKMSVPGRFFVQKFLGDAVEAKCDWVVMEMTSEGIKQSRHRFLELNAVIFTGLEPEHIESHGSFEKYLEAKLELPKLLARSSKRPRTIISNCDNEHGEKFLQYEAENKIAFHLADTHLNPPIPGDFMKINAGLAEAFAKSQGISGEIITKGISSLTSIPGRVKFVKISDEQKFDVVVDYAHTPGSLEALYKAFTPPNMSESISKRKLICVLGNTGGGRDTWKRPVMGKIADEYCDEIILTNEDPYDEEPEKILRDMTSDMKKEPRIIMDRREAIAQALRHALACNKNTIVLITGKGTDPYIMGANGKKIPWSDEEVAREELQNILKNG